MNEETIKFINELHAYCNELDKNRFMRMLGKPKRGVSSINVKELDDWIRESHETGRAILAFAVAGHLLNPKSANYATGIVVANCAALYSIAYAQHPEYQSFMNIVRNCVPNLNELILDAAKLFKSQ